MMRSYGMRPATAGTLNPGALEITMAVINERNPDYRLAGSLGRAVLYDLYYDDPYYEFNARRELPLRTNSLTTRDIDLINAPVVPTLVSPYPLDTVWGNNKTAQVVQDEEGVWRLQSRRHSFDEPLHPDVMAPVHGRTVYGIETVTVHPQTHLALFAVRGALHHKDKTPVVLLTELLQQETPPLPALPQTLLDPFYDLRELQQKGLRHILRKARARISSK